MTIAFIVLNIIQAVAEFLPISSSGHLILAEYLFNMTEGGLEAALHLPTALAIIIVYWTVFLALAKEPKRWPALLAAIIPAGIVGLLFDDYITAIFYSPFIIGCNLILWGIVFILTAGKHAKTTTWTYSSWKDISVKDAFIIGCAQVLALIPGTSRSGITTLTGIHKGLAPSESARFSFIAGFPLILAASLLGFVKAILDGTTELAALSPFALGGGLLLSLGLGIVFIQLFTSKHTLLVLRYSGYYRIILGIFILLWL